MDGDSDSDVKDSGGPPSPSPPIDSPADQDRGIVEAFLSRLFQDRFLTDTDSLSLSQSPAAFSAPPPQPQPPALQPQPPQNNLVPFFAAASVLATPQHSDLRTAEHPAHRRRSLPAAATPMQTTQHVVFCVDDTVGLKDDKYSVGVVDRSFTDVDTHEPRPQRDYGEDIERHTDISLAEFHKFLKTGVAPRGAVLV